MPSRHPRVRVLLVGPSTDILGGQAVQAARLLSGLRESTIVDVRFLAVNPRLPGPLHLLQRIKFVRTIATSAAYFGSLLRRVPHVDVVHAFSASYWSFLLAPLPAMIIGRLFGKRTVLNYRSGEAEDHLGTSRIAVRAIRKFASDVVVPSGYLVSVFQRFGIAAQAIPNVVPLATLPYRQRHAFQPRFLANRNLEPLYNVACTIRAFAKIRKRVPSATLSVVGDGSCRSALEALVHERCDGGVTFHGRIPPSEMGAHYDAADFYLNSPNIDNMPTSVLEAFACGLPVITTAAGGIPYIVEDQESGLLVPLDDDAAMADVALRMLTDWELARRIADRAREDCTARYTWSTLQAQWEQFYSGRDERHSTSPTAQQVTAPTASS